MHKTNKYKAAAIRAIKTTKSKLKQADIQRLQKFGLWDDCCQI